MNALMVVQSVVGHAAVLTGIGLFCIAGVGLLRFGDAYSRLAATTKSGTLGVCLVLLGVLVLEPTWSHAVILAVAVALQIITSPVGGFALGRAAFRSDAPMPAGIRYDELHEHAEVERQETVRREAERAARAEQVGAAGAGSERAKSERP
nr:monovalent cation/H(+) antiporter subunit G [uncultured Actinotalea sp.]